MKPVVNLLMGVIFLAAVLATPSMAATKVPTLMMATTSSTDNTGLLDYLAPYFTKATGIDLRWTASGTGKALRLGENCDVDLLMVHAPAAEKRYVAAGYGAERRQVMFNDFVIIGPSDDPAGIKGASLPDALQTIAARRLVFVSRGDNSGTHKRELALWRASGMTLPDRESWYAQTGQGMLKTINIASEKRGYTLTDRGTFIKYGHNHNSRPPLVALVEGDASLKNQYSVMLVNPLRCPKVKKDLARQFCDWICSTPAQKLIADFRLSGQQLFTPNAE